MGRSMKDVGYLERPDGERIAYRARPGKGPGLFWLSGFKSDMGGTKAAHLANWAAGAGRAFTAFDYFGHGASSGDFRAGTIGRWIADARAAFEALTKGPQLLIGSSMGGWIALHLAHAVKSRIAGLVLIAPAADFTEDLIWAALPEGTKKELKEKGVWLRPSAYDPDPYPITLSLIEEGRRHLLLRAPIDVDVPVHILHGMKDTDVPYERSHLLCNRLASDDVIIELIKSGDHRLSAPAELKRLEEAVAGMADRLA